MRAVPSRAAWWGSMVRIACQLGVLRAALGIDCVHAQPPPIDPPAARAFISNQGSHDVSVIELPSGREVRRLPVAAGPAGVAVDARHGQVYITSPDGRALTAFDTRTLQRRGEVQLGGGPVAIAVDREGEHIYISDWYQNQVLMIRAGTLEVERRINVGRVPAGLAVAPDGRRVYVAERDENRIAVIDTQSGTVIAHVAVGEHPFGLALDESGQRLFAVNVLSNNVTRIETDSLTASATIAVGNSPYCAVVAPDGRVFVSNQHGDSVSVIDGATARLLQTLAVGAYPEGIAVDDHALYVVSWMDEELEVFDLHSLSPILHVATGRNSRGFGAFLWRPVVPQP